MLDKVSLKRLEMLHPKLRSEGLAIFNEINVALTGKAICRIAYTLRTIDEQNALYAQGRTKPGKIVTNAKGGESFHNYGLAIDIVLLKDTNGDGTFETASWETDLDFDGDGVSDWMEIVKIFKLHGWTAGIDWAFRDAPHFEKSFGYSIKQLQKLQKDSNGYVIF